MLEHPSKVIFHTRIPIEDTRLVFESQPGRRKIILSTNIAESSVTIPDVKVTCFLTALTTNQNYYDEKSVWLSLQILYLLYHNLQKRVAFHGCYEALKNHFV